MAEADLLPGTKVRTVLHPLGTPNEEGKHTVVVATVTQITLGRAPYGNKGVGAAFGPPTVWVDIDGTKLGAVPRARVHVTPIASGNTQG